MISTRDLSRLPDADGLLRVWQSMAMLDAILCPERDLRYWSFNSSWAPGEQIGSMRNGSGDELFAHFSRAGCWLKGFAHESPMSPYRDGGTKGVWPGVLDSVPAEFASCLTEPAFSVGDVTFCIWRLRGDREWHSGSVQFPPGDADPDGSEFLLAQLGGRPERYQAWPSEYFGRDVDLEAVRHVHRQEPLTPEIVGRLNPAASLSDLDAEIDEIGYPRERGSNLSARVGPHPNSAASIVSPGPKPKATQGRGASSRRSRSSRNRTVGLDMLPQSRSRSRETARA